LVEASSYSDETEAAWLAKANDPSVTFDMLSDSGGARFIGLDSMLAAGLQSKIQTGGIVSPAKERDGSRYEPEDALEGKTGGTSYV